MEVNRKEEMNRTYTIFSGDTVQTDSYPVQLVLHHMLDGLVPASVYTMDQKQVWSCEHTGKISLLDYCKGHELNKLDVQWILGGILNNLQEVQEYLLDVQSIYIDVSEVYLELSENRVWNCYVPFYKDSIYERLQDMIRFLLGHLNQQETETVRLLYGIYQYLDQGGTQLETIWKMLYEKKQGREKDERKFYQNEEINLSQDFSEQKSMDKKWPMQKSTEQKWSVQKSANQKPAESKTMDRDFTEEREPEKNYSYIRWGIIALPIALALFLLLYLTWNEWYLSNQKKILLLVLAAGFMGIGIFLWYRWHFSLKKINPLNGSIYTGDPIQKQTVAELVRRDTGKKFLLDDTVLIGKSAERVQVLICSPVVSRIHAKISIRDEAYYLEDIHSKNGTYINGIRLEPEKPVRLQDGDALVFANVSFDFQLSNT